MEVGKDLCVIYCSALISLTLWVANLSLTKVSLARILTFHYYCYYYWCCCADVLFDMGTIVTWFRKQNKFKLRRLVLILVSVLPCPPMYPLLLISCVQMQLQVYVLSLFLCKRHHTLYTFLHFAFILLLYILVFIVFLVFE